LKVENIVQIYDPQPGMPNVLTDKIFLGHTPSDQRKFILDYLKKNHDKFEKVHVPCCGTFSLVKTAIEAGYKPSDITCSDISLFSTLLGYFIMGKPISEMGFKMSPLVEAEYNTYQTEDQKVAFLLYIMKREQYKPLYYEQIRRNQLEFAQKDAMAQFTKQILDLKERYHGILYFVEDIREAIAEKPATITIINTPVIAKGYTKMFDFHSEIDFDPQIAEFNWGKEYKDLFEKSTQLESTFIWYRFKHLKGIDSKYVVYAKQYPKRWDYWLINKPEEYKDERIVKRMPYKNITPIKGMPMFTEGDITESSQVRIIPITEENALYYRDLYAHKLGATRAETYVGMIIDGKLFGTAGFMMRDALSMKCNYVFESYAFSTVNPKYPDLGRLLMMCLTSRQTRDFLYSQYPKNRIYRLDAFKTTCLSKYRKVKKNNGLMKIVERVKLANFYKISYFTDFWDRSYNDCVKVWLDELKNGRTNNNSDTGETTAS
jgi:hypothetical protein